MLSSQQFMSLRRIASRSNLRVKEWASLANRKFRRELGLTLADGARLCQEAFLRGTHRYRPEVFLISDRGAENPSAGELLDLAAQLGVEAVGVSDEVFDKVSGLKNADGLALVLRPAETVDITFEAILRSRFRLLVAAEVQDPGNAGALARTALAAGFDGCIFLGGADPSGPKFLRGSMGAAFSLPCFDMTEENFTESWRQSGGRLGMATSAAPAEDYRRADFSPPFALLVGGERGVPDSLAALADARVRIPLSGRVESLNLAVAAGIILFEAVRHGTDG
ncbi:MAG: RNA methyltransferase [Planctomycetaceae bacterium]|nr:RNA methyltransferase [Planctomycetaceae bacterium]